ncbi:MAG: T9SS type A sorting domain-containing protein [Draconibacterium sp.]|nr:T9SS type A sorting domain-containing protein [Draconibacterium sp.]
MKNLLTNSILILLVFFNQQSIIAQNANYYGSKEEDIANSIVQYDNNFYILGTTRVTEKSSTDYYVVQLNANGSLKKEFTFGEKHGDVGKHILVNKGGIFVLGKSWDGGFPNNDMVLTKLDFEGKQKWKKFYGGEKNDLGHKFIITKDNGFAMVGFNRSVDDFGDVYLVKANNDGEMVWENHFGGRYVDHGFDVIENEKGEFIVVGTLGGFYNPTSTDYLNHDADVFIIKTNSLGEEIWLKTFGGASHDWAKEIIAAPGGGYYVCGSTQSEGAGSFDFFLMKIDDNGNKLWSKTYGGTDFDYGETMRISKDQKLYILGSSASYSDNYKPDHLLIKTDLEGEIIWSNTFGGNGSDYSSAMVCTNDSGCVFTGWTDNGNIGKKDIVFYKISKDGIPKFISSIPRVNDSIEQIKVFPNPVNNNFSVLINTKLITDFKLNLYNIKGVLIYNKMIHPNVLSTHQPQFPSGIYLFTIQNNNNVVFNGKLVFN